MTGPFHYTEAEALIQEAAKNGKSPAGVMALLARAQVHATLALAAATGLQRRDGDFYLNEWSAWDHVAGVAS